MTVTASIVDLAIALGLGLLVGLQRESAEKSVAGLRTFAFVTACGTVCGLLIPTVPWIVPAGFLSLALLVATAYFLQVQRDGDGGLTTEIALLAMFLVGVYLVAGDRVLGVVFGGSIAVLLQAKGSFRKVMERLGSGDVRAIMKFALLSLVILPVLTDEDFGPWNVFNLFETWLMVVLIVGINLAGYVLYKFTSADTGALAGGLLGGVISSTATTVSYSKRAKASPEAAPLGAVVVMIATAVVMIRVLIEVFVVAPRLLASVALPLGIMLGVSLAVSLVAWWQVRRSPADMPEQSNPTMLTGALAFAAAYVIVKLAVAWVRQELGSRGLFVVAGVAGLTDVDAITLSTAKLGEDGTIPAAQVWRVILVAFLSNLVFKAGIVAATGSRSMFLRVALMFAILAAAGVLLLMVM